MQPTNFDKESVYCVSGKPYYANFAVRTFWSLILWPSVIALITGDWHHVLGTVMVVLGAVAANARFSPVHGCLVWLPIIGIAIWGASRLEFAIPLIAWGAVAWIVGCIECRRTLVPYEGHGSNPKPAA